MSEDDKKWVGTEYDSKSSWPTDEDWKRIEESIQRQCERGSYAPTPLLMSPEALKAWQKAMEFLKNEKI